MTACLISAGWPPGNPSLLSNKAAAGTGDTEPAAEQRFLNMSVLPNGASDGNSADNELLAAALAYAAQGVAVFPCEPCDKQPCGALVGRDRDAQGGWIRNSGGLRKATRDPALITEWWTLRPDAMISAATGEVSGIVAIDPDAPKPVKVGPLDQLIPDGRVAWAELKEKFGGHESTLEHATPSGGAHVLFRYDPQHPLTNKEGALSGLGSTFEVMAVISFFRLPGAPTVREPGTFG